MKNNFITIAAALTALVSAPIMSHAQSVSTATTPTATDFNSLFASTGRLGAGVIGIVGKNESGSVSKGLSFQKTDAILTFDALRYKTPVFGIKGETSIGIYISTNNVNIQNGSFGPQANYSVGRTFIGIAYVPNHGQNSGQFIIGHRL